GFGNGQLNPPSMAAGQPGSPLWWTATIDASGIVHLQVDYNGTVTTDGILKVYAVCQRAMAPFESIPSFNDVAEGLFAVGQPLETTPLQDIEHNAEFGAVRKECFDLGFWRGGSTVSIPTSLIDGYAYTRDEVRYKAIWYTNLPASGGFTNGQ